MRYSFHIEYVLIKVKLTESPKILIKENCLLSVIGNKISQNSLDIKVGVQLYVLIKHEVRIDKNECHCQCH